MKRGLKLIHIIIIFTSTLLSIYGIVRFIIFPKKYEDIVNSVAKEYNVDPYLIYAIIKKESNFNKNAISRSNAKGLMQLMNSTANEVVQSINTIPNNGYDIYDEYNNICIGTKYLSDLIKIYNGNIYLAVSAYNAGLGNINNWIKEDSNYYDNVNKVIEILSFNETKTYLIDVIRYYNMYKIIY